MMKSMLIGLVLLLPLRFGSGQQVHLADGEVIAATVRKLENNRVHLRTPDGKILRYAPGRIRFALDQEGKKIRFAAEFVKGPIPEPKKAILEALNAGGETGEMQLVLLAEDLCADLFRELQVLARSEDEIRRLPVLRVMAMAATPESIALAVEAAVHDPSAKVRAATAQHLSSAVAIAAIDKAGLLALLEEGLDEKDAKARFSIAFAATELGSKAARSVLSRYVKDRDHHIREAAAVCLAEHGDAAGEKVLLQMLKRRESPMIAADQEADAAFLARLRAAELRERCHVCALVGSLRLKSARSTLKTLQRSESEDLARAASAALEALDRESEGD